MSPNQLKPREDSGRLVCITFDVRIRKPWRLHFLNDSWTYNNHQTSSYHLRNKIMISWCCQPLKSSLHHWMWGCLLNISSCIEASHKISATPPSPLKKKSGLSPACCLPVCFCDISLKVIWVEFVQSGFAHWEEQQVEGEDRVDSAHLQELRLLLKLLNGAGLLCMSIRMTGCGVC